MNGGLRSANPPYGLEFDRDAEHQNHFGGEAGTIASEASPGYRFAHPGLRLLIL
jgi:hypothetical protein